MKIKTIVSLALASTALISTIGYAVPSMFTTDNKTRMYVNAGIHGSAPSPVTVTAPNSSRNIIWQAIQQYCGRSPCNAATSVSVGAPGSVNDFLKDVNGNVIYLSMDLATGAITPTVTDGYSNGAHYRITVVGPAHVQINN